jgi:O-antigen/teichoic acid export membrane protein
MCSSVASGILAIVMAYHGYGIWALIAQVMARSFLQASFLVVMSKWIPKLVFYKESCIRLYRYGINLITASCLTKITEEGISFFLGKVFSPYNLGIYTRATQFSVLPSTSIGNVIISVLFPTLSLVKDDKDKFKQIYNAIIKIMSALSMPVFVILVVIAEPFIRLVLTEKWIEVVPFLQVFCIGRLLFPVSNVTEQALNAVGRSDLFLKQQIRKMAVKAIFILPALFFDIYVVAIADALSSMAAYFITTMVARKVLNIGLLDQLRSIIWYMIFALGAGALSYYFEFFIENDHLKIIFAIIIYPLIYLLVVFSFKRTEIMNFRKLIK